MNNPLERIHFLIYTVTLNPAIDKILFLDEFNRSRTARIKKVVESIGGKGTHVSIDLKLLGAESIALGITFGTNGRKVAELMRSQGIETRFLHYDLPGFETRTNYEVVEEANRSATMLTERGPLLPVKVTNDLVEQLSQTIKTGDLLVLTGDASNVDDQEIYAKLCMLAEKLGARIILDASGKYLEQGIRSNPWLIKPNYEELCTIAGRELATESEIIDALKSPTLSRIQVIAMTWSGNGSVVKNGDAVYRVYPVKINLMNEAGCGDAFLAALIYGISRSFAFEETLKLATSVSGAAAETELTVGFDPHRVEQLIREAKVEKL